MCIYSLPLYIPLVLCTFNETSSSRVIQNIAPVQVIIDQAAMTTEPESMVAIKLASDHVTLIGDHMQLQVHMHVSCLLLLCILKIGQTLLHAHNTCLAPFLFYYHIHGIIGVSNFGKSL